MKNKSLVFACLIITAAMLMVNACSGDNAKAIRVGDTIAPFSGTDLEKKPFTLAAHQGRPVIVRFFLIDCPYCKADTPIFNKFYDTYRKNGLEIVYINNNGTSIEEVQDFVRDLQIAFPVIYDQEGRIAKQYNVKIQPLTLILSPEHKLLAALLGGVSEAELQELLGPYLRR